MNPSFNYYQSRNPSGINQCTRYIVTLPVINLLYIITNKPIINLVFLL